MDILIFKTNVSGSEHVESVRPHLHELHEILKWNFDLLDEEFILRIEAHHNLNPRKVERVLSNAGYYCQELQTFSGVQVV
ncbi:hypothetical protein BDE36_3665 [Arcticibacter tournemirensis]|uniref:Copper chaperone n=1 Tax=Arcticibacter tournemirensis TaxID=699437 RepID=A0A5M9HFK7_9SPHI|nr:hypothetical protein [Arcticibacter tournemirensis]KAA8484128.1 hypothetical protein F1649_07255 [Arcticibacter tournemirensis]TQM51872.1 hypothetical protein BDE36_3665 [Arcticibacter tournemirensis]